jgi:hypothetical protein
MRKIRNTFSCTKLERLVDLVNPSELARSGPGNAVR